MATNLLKRTSLLFFTPHCYDNYLIKFNFFDGPCFSATLSKFLGLVIILNSLVVKLPQIIKIYKNKSGQGISLLSVTLDLSAVTIYTSYSFLKGFPFSAWGDAFFFGVQTLAIAIFVLHYEGATFKAILYLISHLLLCTIMMRGFIPISVVWSLQGCNIFIAVSGKLTQAWSNYKNGSLGQLSVVTVFLMFFSSLARIFTSVQETGDKMVILTYIANTSAIGVLVGQVFYYWDVVPEMKKTQ